MIEIMVTIVIDESPAKRSPAADSIAGEKSTATASSLAVEAALDQRQQSSVTGAKVEHTLRLRRYEFQKRPIRLRRGSELNRRGPNSRRRARQKSKD